MLAIWPRAAERLQTYTAAWPLPRLFRTTEGGMLNEGLSRADSINTPSVLCVADALDVPDRAERVGGLPAVIARSQADLAAVGERVARSKRALLVAESGGSASGLACCLFHLP